MTDSDDMRVQLLVEENERLNGRVREFEERYAPVFVVESILKLLYDEYTKQTATAPTTLSLTRKFYARGDKSIAPLPDTVEYLIESLWLGRMDACPFDFNGKTEALMLHPSQLRDDRPLPIIKCADGTSVPVVKRPEHRSHIFLMKHDPAFNGIVIDHAHAKLWASNSRIATSTEVSHFPQHRLLSSMINLWAGRGQSSSSLAALVVDASQVRNFVSTLARNDKARCHFTCTGQTELYAYFVITSGDGSHLDLQRLFLGSMKI